MRAVIWGGSDLTAAKVENEVWVIANDRIIRIDEGDWGVQQIQLRIRRADYNHDWAEYTGSEGKLPNVPKQTVIQT